MFKRLTISLVLLSATLFLVSPAMAQFGLGETAAKAQYSETTSIYSTISTIISLGLSLAGLIFLAIMFYAGLRWMTARGDDEKVNKAKDAMYAALIGFILVTVSYGISAFVFSRLIK